MPIGLVTAGIGAATAIGGAVINANAQDDAASAVAKGSKLSNATQLQIYNDNKAQFAPYTGAGVAALDPLMASYGLKGQAAQDAAIASFHSAPDYQFSLDQGLKGVEGSAAARGGAYSGGALKALQRYGSDYANNYLGTWRQGLQGLVNTGVGGAQNTAAAGANYANSYGANTMNAANARGTAYANTGASYAGAGQDLATLAAWGAGKFLGPGQPSTYGGGVADPSKHG